MPMQMPVTASAERGGTHRWHVHAWLPRASSDAALKPKGLCMHHTTVLDSVIDRSGIRP
ncbi:hypothetical protein [Xanthomonas sp. 3058]|uniref:hypothetical protein n=1 Tax=Xanthomonas sp. 3058 TaxID=3035314 RepID=UPI00160C507F|nr:hypothetical protein [Xanthomonas sp. 3058]MBB5864143.1 hypothetical protein [Xanthomonas sp. 3058]